MTDRTRTTDGREDSNDATTATRTRHDRGSQAYFFLFHNLFVYYTNLRILDLSFSNTMWHSIVYISLQQRYLVFFFFDGLSF